MRPVAVDTNLLVRLATGDDAAEYRAVTESLSACPWLVITTVLLEVEWVLRSVYGYSRDQFSEFVEWLGGNERITFADPQLVLAAVAHHRAGLDFADALHVEQAKGGLFLTLDKSLVRRATKRGLNAMAVAVSRRK